MYKMICLDLDGTLLRDDKLIDKSTLNYLNDLADKGIEILIATGRHYDYAKYLTRGLSEDRIIVSNNGAGVFDAAGWRIFTNPLPVSTATEILERAYRKDYCPYAYVDCTFHGWDLGVVGDIDCSDFEGVVVRSMDRIKSLNMDFVFEEVLSVVVSGHIGEMTDLAQRLESSLENLSYHVMPMDFDDYAMLEVMAAGVNKWTSIKKYGVMRGISPEEVIAFGDQRNDWEMIQGAGLGIAMRSGCKELLEMADLVSKEDNNNSGIYHELKEIFGDLH